MAAKKLLVLGIDGVGKKTLIGNLIYKCGLGLSQLEELERKGIRHYAEIASFYQSKGHDQSFHVPSGLFIVQSTMTAKQQPDVVFWVVDAADTANWADSAHKLAASLSTEEIYPREKLFILVKKMDLVSWSEHVFEDVVRKFNAVGLKENHVFIPVSGLTGENLLCTPKNHKWLNVSARHSGAARISVHPLVNQLGCE